MISCLDHEFDNRVLKEKSNETVDSLDTDQVTRLISLSHVESSHSFRRVDLRLSYATGQSILDQSLRGAHCLTR